MTFLLASGGHDIRKYINNAWTPMTRRLHARQLHHHPHHRRQRRLDADPYEGSFADPSGPAAPVEPIPTLSVWGLLASAGLLGLFGAWRQRRRR
jgi:hypothetical protein